ncbi:MAG: hypothetical protein AAF337_00070 [Pseudomonadota bacterium]
MTVYLKDPAATLAYTIDWTAHYLVTDSVVASRWRLEPQEQDGLVIEGSDISGNVTRLRVSGGIAGHVYRLANEITLASGDIDERDIVIRVGER